MTNHHFTASLSKRSFPLDNNYIINNERIPKYEKTFVNIITKERFIKTDVQIALYKRNKFIKEFFRKYESDSLYSMIEIGFDFNISEKASFVLLKINRNLKKMGTSVLGYIWLVDKGENCNMHFHLVIAIERLNYKGTSLPDELKLTFKTKRLHSSFVTNKKRMMEYLLKKKIYFIGKRKRVFGKSRFFHIDNKTKKLQ